MWECQKAEGGPGYQQGKNEHRGREKGLLGRRPLPDHERGEQDPGYDDDPTQIEPLEDVATGEAGRGGRHLEPRFGRPVAQGRLTGLPTSGLTPTKGLLQKLKGTFSV